MISLRLSEVEYEDLKSHYRAYGVRNVSELARLALQRTMAGSAGQEDGSSALARLVLQQMMNESSRLLDGFASRLSDLDERVHQLESQVALLLEREKVLS
jgi:hypothetical protein